MKNKLSRFCTKLVVLLGVCFLLTSFSPSLDGRAVVVEEGVFPQGLFAKTVGYLPGDIISVANIAGDTTVDLLVIGALDPSEGVAIMLTPEAAEAIGIDKDSSNIVKITKRSGQDERVYGTAVIGKASKKADDAAKIYDPEEHAAEEAPVEPETPVAESVFDEPAPEEPAIEEPVVESAVTEEPVAEEPVALETEPAVDEPFGPVPEEVVPEETPVEEIVEPEEIAPVAVEEEIVAEPVEVEDLAEPVEEPFETIAATPDEQPEEAEPVIEYVELPAEETPVEEEVPAEDMPVTEEVFVAEENVAPSAPVEEPLEETLVEDDPLSPIGEETELPPEEELVNDDIPAAIDDSDLDVIEATEPFDEAAKEEQVAEEVDNLEDYIMPEEDTILEPLAEEEPEQPFDETEPYEEYEAIVLVPAVENPPVVEEAPVEEPAAEPVVVTEPEEVVEVVEAPADDVVTIDEAVAPEDSNIFTPAVEEPEQPVVEVTPVIEPAPVEVVTPSATSERSLEKYVVSSLKELESGKYYIQIAALSSEENIWEIIDKYGNHYPITVVPMAGGKTKQVLVGPVSMDEYKVVLERFKSYGYKDAFLRKIK